MGRNRGSFGNRAQHVTPLILGKLQSRGKGTHRVRIRSLATAALERGDPGRRQPGPVSEFLLG